MRARRPPFSCSWLFVAPFCFCGFCGRLFRALQTALRALPFPRLANSAARSAFSAPASFPARFCFVNSKKYLRKAIERPLFYPLCLLWLTIFRRSITMVNRKIIPRGGGSRRQRREYGFFIYLYQCVDHRRPGGARLFPAQGKAVPRQGGFRPRHAASVYRAALFDDGVAFGQAVPPRNAARLWLGHPLRGGLAAARLLPCPPRLLAR